MWNKLLDCYDFVYFVIKRFFEDRGTQNAGSLTYTTLFAVVPMLTVLFVMLSGIPQLQDVSGVIQKFIVDNFLPSAGDKIQDYLQDFVSQARQLTWIGVIFLIATSFMMLVTIEQAFNSIWRVKKPRYGLQRFLLYWALLSLGPILIGAGFAVSGYIMSLTVISDSATISGVLSYSPLLLSVLGFTLIYSAIPNTRVPLSHAFISGFVTAIFIETAKFLFGLYVQTFHSYQLIYGAFAAVPLFLLWVYVSWVIVLMGFELSCCLGLRHYLFRQEIPNLLVAIATLKLFYEAQVAGKVVTQQDVQEKGWLLPEDEWFEMVGFFEEERLVCAAGSGYGWILCRDINSYGFYELIAHSPWPIPKVAQIPVELLEEPWFAKIKQALSAIEEAHEHILTGSLASWLTDKA